MENLLKGGRTLDAFVIGAAVVLGLYLSSHYNYLLYHSLVEMLGVIAAFCIFVIAWNSRRILQNNYLLFLGIAYLFIGGLGMLHAYAYKGMGVFVAFDADLPTQLWIAARYMEAVSLLAAPLFLSRRLPSKAVLTAYMVVTAAVIYSIFAGIFPQCYIEGQGLTQFKINSEYLISVIMGASFALLIANRARFEKKVLMMMCLSIGSSIAAELALTAYISVYGPANMIGHYLKLLSVYFIYKAIIETGFSKPLSLMAVDLKQSERSLADALEESARRGAETAALLGASRAVLKSQDFTEAARSIFDYCRELIGARAGYVALLSEDGSNNEVLFLDSGGLPCSVDPALPMPIRGLRAEVYKSGNSMFENNFPSSEWEKFMPEGHVELSNVLFAPLLSADTVIGLLGFGNKPGGFTKDDARMATAFGELASVSLLNSRNLESLEASEERFRAVAQTANDAIITVDAKGLIAYFNPAAEIIFGYEEDELSGKPISLILPEGYPGAGSDGATGDALTSPAVESLGISRSGAEFPVELSASSWRTPKGAFVTGIIRDITERKHFEAALKQSETRYRTLFTRMMNGFAYHRILLDSEGAPVDYVFLEVNEAFERLTGLRGEDIKGKRVTEVLPDITESAYDWIGAYGRVALTGEEVKFEEYFEGLEKWFSVSAFSPEKEYFGVILEDITERKKAEESLRVSLREKETLIKEIHHRAKNNLMVISSLLRLQAGEIEDQEARELFVEAQNRVTSMSMIHERLYRSADLSSIDIGEYVLSLTVQLFRSYKVSGTDVKLVTDVEHARLDIDSMIPCGLILNELISNALKYAFPAGRRGELRIALKEVGEGALMMSVSDNGVGLPEGMDIYKTDSLGMQLVTSLVKQLQGSLEVSTTGGTSFRIGLGRHLIAK